MRREVRFWLMVYGVMAGFVLLAVAAAFLPSIGQPAGVALAVAVLILPAYVLSVWRAFLKRQ